MFPYTHLGRSNILIIAIFGNFFLGLFTVALQGSLEHDLEQYMSKNSILKTKARKEYGKKGI
jgi:hypothetical protein